jgi:hypothetical protein
MSPEVATLSRCSLTWLYHESAPLAYQDTESALEDETSELYGARRRLGG